MDSDQAFTNVVAGRVLGRQSELCRASAGSPVKRPVFLKPHGCAVGTFEVLPHLPHDLAVGVFSGSTYDVRVRFSSDAPPDANDGDNHTLGLGVKLIGVPGRKMLEGHTDADTQDFVLQNSDVFPAANARQFMELTEASLRNGIKEYLGLHPVAAKIVAEMSKPEASVLTTNYNSVTPYRFGRAGRQFVKYLVRPAEAPPTPATPPGKDDPNYLAKDLQRRLEAAPVKLDFLVQLRSTPQAMPLDDATVAWDPVMSAPTPIATITLAQQDIASGQDFEDLSFNPWHTLAAHEPVGSLNAARRVAYVLSADARRRMNGAPLAEPTG